MSISTTSQTLVVELAAITTTLSGCAGGVVSLFYFHWKTRVWDAVALCNGVLCGLVRSHEFSLTGKRRPTHEELYSCMHATY